MYLDNRKRLERHQERLFGLAALFLIAGCFLALALFWPEFPR
jgi:hypothetical protein